VNRTKVKGIAMLIAVPPLLVAGGTLREMTVEGKPFDSAIETGLAVAGGYVVLLILVWLFLAWVTSERKGE
jgi:hypothetical protein